MLRRWVMVFFAAFLIVSCSQEDNSQAKKEEVKKIEKVKVGYPKYSEIEDKLYVLGNIVPFKEVAVTAEVQGKVNSIKVQEGNMIRKNKVLLTIDEEPFVLAVKKAETALKQSESNLNYAENMYKETLLSMEKKFYDIEKMKIQIRQTELELKEKERDYKNKEILHEKEGISTTVLKKLEVEYEEVKSKYEMAKNNLDSEMIGFRDEDIKRELGFVPEKKEDKIEKIKEIRTRTEKAKLNIAKSEHQKYKIELEEAQILLGKCVIQSPIDGVVGVKKINEGEMIQRDNPVLVLFSTHKVYAEFEINEEDIYRINYGIDVSMQVDAYPGKTFNGKVSVISPLINQKTRTSVVRVEVDNQKMELKPGMFVRGTFYPKKKRKVMVIPEKAISSFKGDKADVFVYKDNYVIKKSVFLETEKKDSYFVVRDGLYEKDLIVLENSGSLSEGLKVEAEKIDY